MTPRKIKETPCNIIELSQQGYPQEQIKFEMSIHA